MIDILSLQFGWPNESFRYNWIPLVHENITYLGYVFFFGMGTRLTTSQLRLAIFGDTRAANKGKGYGT